MYGDNLLGVDPTQPPGGLFGAGPQPTFPNVGPMAAPTPPQRPSILSRIGGLLRGIGGGIDNALVGSAPPGYEGLLSQDDVQQAKPGFLRTLFTGPNALSPQHQWEMNLDSILKHRMLGQQLQQEAQLRQQRQQIFSDLPAPTTGDPEHEKQWAMSVIPRLAAIGDEAGVQRINSFLDTMMKQPPRVPGVLFKNDKTGEVRSLDTSAGQSIPPGWSKLPSDAAQGYDAFVGKDGSTVYVKKGDNEGAAKQTAAGRRILSNENITIGQEGANARHSDSDVMRLQTGFRSDVKPLTDQAATYDKALYTINRAMNSTDPNERKLLFGAVKSQFVQSSDQSKNLRYQLLQYYEHNMDPSVYGTFDQMLDKMSNGEIPNRLLAPMMAHIKGLQQQTRAQIEARRQGFLNTNAGRLDPTDLPATDTYFPFAGEYKDSPALNPTGAGNHLPGNPFAKKKN
jgi:hypothetical protein